MPLAVSTVTQSGQITLPKEIRNILGVKPHDQVALVSDGTRVELVAVPEDPLTLHDRGELWDRLAVARNDVAEGRTSPAGALTSAMREKYGL